MSEYDIALDNQIEWASFWTSDNGRRLYEGIQRAVSRKRREAGERHPEDILDVTPEQDILMMMPLLNGECFYWSRGIIDVVSVAAQSLPDSWCLMKQDIPAASGFFWFAKEPGIEYRGIRAFGWTLLSVGDKAAAVYIPRNNGAMPDFDTVALVIFTGNPDFPKPLPSLSRIVVGQPLSAWRLEQSDYAVSINANPDEFNYEYQALRLFAVMLSFIQQKILVTSRHITSRATRRRVAPSRSAEADINIVKLRSVVRHDHKGEELPVEWSCRWLVRGHWRDQWFPSIKKNRPIWIRPYIKGPEDKPLRDPGRLFAVVR